MGEVNVSATEPRFFIEHGVVHDRKTGKHLRGVVFEWENDSPENLLAVLRELENEAFSWKHTARAFDARAEQAEAALSVAQKDAESLDALILEMYERANANYDAAVKERRDDDANEAVAVIATLNRIGRHVGVLVDDAAFAHGGAGEGCNG